MQDVGRVTGLSRFFLIKLEKKEIDASDVSVTDEIRVIGLVAPYVGLDIKPDGYGGITRVLNLYILYRDGIYYDVWRFLR